MSFVRPFARHGNWTVFDNALVDTLLPHLPASSWAVLSVILRQTSGWQREVVAAPLRDLAEATGMREGAVSAALAVLTSEGTFPVALVDPSGGPVLLSNAATRSRREPLAYRLNPDFRLVTSAVRRLRDDDPESAVRVHVQTGVLDNAHGVSTSIFGVLSTSIFGALYKKLDRETKSGASPRLHAFADVADEIARRIDALSSATQIRTLIALARALYGDEGIPPGREAAVEAGKLRQFAGSAGAAARLLFEDAAVRVRGNPFRYCMASASGARRDAARARAAAAPERLAAEGPRHLALYDTATARAFVEAGTPRERFVGGPRTPQGEPTYRYLAPRGTTAT